MAWSGGSAALGGKTGEVHYCLYRHCLCTLGTQRLPRDFLGGCSPLVLVFDS